MPTAYVNRLHSFAALTPQDMDALEGSIAMAEPVPPRRDLARDGDAAGSLLVMKEGWAFSYKTLPGGTRQVMSILMPGDACDLDAGVVAEMEYGIQTMTAAQVMIVPADKVCALMRSPGIARALYVARLVEARALRSWIVCMGRRTSVERVAQLLMELFLRATHAGLARNGTVELPLSQVVLADALGMTAVHINRVLQDLRRAQAVELQRRVLRIIDPGALARISGFDGNYLQRRLREQST